MWEDALYLRSVELRAIPEGEESYVFSLPMVRRLGRLEFQKQVTFLVGENGAGKSTLIEAVAVGSGFNPEGGTRNFSFSTSDSHSPLWKYLSVAKGPRRPRDGFFLRAESFYNVATNLDELNKIKAGRRSLIDYYGGRSLHEQSHGESFLALALNRFSPQGLYLLDEPEAALSPTGQMTLLARIYALAREGAQFVIATHSPILTACPGADIYQLTGEGFARTPYRETENYRLTAPFWKIPSGCCGTCSQRSPAGTADRPAGRLFFLAVPRGPGRTDHSAFSTGNCSSVSQSSSLSLFQMPSM